MTGSWFIIIPVLDSLLAFPLFQWKKTERGRYHRDPSSSGCG